MKLVIAYFKPERLNAVKEELFKRNIFKMSVTNALGCGQQKGHAAAFRGAISEVTLLKKVRVAIGVNDAYVRRSTLSSPEPAPARSATERYSSCRWSNACASARAKPGPKPSASAPQSIQPKKRISGNDT